MKRELVITIFLAVLFVFGTGPASAKEVVIGTIGLKSGVNLHIEAGATLLGSTRREDYRSVVDEASGKPVFAPHAVIEAGGARVGVIGLGGLGQIGARVGVLAGAEVYVAEIDEEVWDLAHDLGATGVARSIRGFADRQLDVIVDFAGFGTTTAEAIEAVRFGGRVVQVGMGKLEATISTRDLIIKECELVGCRGGTSDDIAGVYELFATGQLAPHYTEIGFDDSSWRAGTAASPQLDLVDIRGVPLKAGLGPVSRRLVQETLARGEQTRPPRTVIPSAAASEAAESRDPPKPGGRCQNATSN